MANKANWYYSARENRWRLSGKAGSDLLQVSDAGQLLLNGTSRQTGVATFHTLLNVGTQALARALNIAAVATIGQNLNVGSQAVAQNLDIGLVATIGRSLNVGTQARVQQLMVGSGSNVNFIRGYVATLVQDISVASGNALGVGTLQSATGSGVGIAGINVADFIWGIPKIALDTAQVVGFRVPTTDTLNVYVTPRDQSLGSLAAGAGFDIFQIRAS